MTTPTTKKKVYLKGYVGDKKFKVEMPEPKPVPLYEAMRSTTPTKPTNKKEKTVLNLYGINFVCESRLHWWWMKLQPWKFKEIAKGVMLRK